MTIDEYKETLSKLYVQATTDLAAAMVKLPSQDDRSRNAKHHEFQKLSVLTENLLGALKNLSGA